MHKIRIVVITIITTILFWFIKIYDFRGDTILIPNNYVGNLIIFYNVKTGIKIENKSIFERNIFKISSSGVLKVNCPFYLNRNIALRNVDFYYYDIKTGEILSKFKKTDHFNYLNGNNLLYENNYYIGSYKKGNGLTQDYEYEEMLIENQQNPKPLRTVDIRETFESSSIIY